MEEKYNNYMDFVKDARSFNSLLRIARNSRFPFIENQTGIAQTKSLLWKTRNERQQVSNRKEKGIIYSYPATRWQKRRREYLMTQSRPKSTISANVMTISETASSTSNSSRIQKSNTNIASGGSNNTGGSLASLLQSTELATCTIRKVAQSLSSSTSLSNSSSFITTQPVPSRADSTGSHSCITMDSDSRDLSSATSQTFDSPSRHQLASELLELDSHYQTVPNDKQTNSSKITRESEFQEDECQALLGPIRSGSSESMNKIDHLDETISRQEVDKNFEDRTKAAIRMHSRKFRKKNIGQSLMKINNNKNSNCSSLLIRTSRHKHNNVTVENGRNNTSPGNDLKIKIKEEQPHDNGFTDRTFVVQSDEQARTEHEDGSVVKKTELPVVKKNGRTFICSICDQSYKTRPGLSYHLMHTHNTVIPKSISSKTNPSNSTSESRRLSKEKRQSVSAKQGINRSSRLTRATRQNPQEDVITCNQPDQPQSTIHSSVSSDCFLKTSSCDVRSDSEETLIDEDEYLEKDPHVDECLENRNLQTKESVNSDVPEAKLETRGIEQENLNVPNDLENTQLRTEELEKKSDPTKHNPFCDFCLGTTERNRRTRLPEELVSCSKCGSSGHPTCLRFSRNITLSVQKYKWQCIECKTCSTCNDADHEDQLLFCDDCDRSYHTYCLQPPLVELPEGSWSCSSCLVEYHDE